MCGLVGIFDPNGITDTQKKAFEQLLILDVIRGKDSTGIFTEDLGILKELGHPLNLMGSKSYPDKIKSRVLLGHNRAATVGQVNKDSAHPFQYGDVVLAHNGTLFEHLSLLDKDSFGITVDSEAICYAISKRDTVSVLESLDGAYALTWYDSNKKTLNFARNWERPLHLAKVETQKRAFLMWASEEWMLEVVIDKNKSLNVGSKIKIEELPEEEWYSYSMEDKTLSFPKITKFKAPDWVGYNNFCNSYYTNYSPKKESSDYVRFKYVETLYLGFNEEYSVIFRDVDNPDIMYEIYCDPVRAKTYQDKGKEHIYYSKVISSSGNYNDTGKLKDIYLVDKKFVGKNKYKKSLTSEQKYVTLADGSRETKEDFDYWNEVYGCAVCGRPLGLPSETLSWEGELYHESCEMFFGELLRGLL